MGVCSARFEVLDPSAAAIATTSLAPVVEEAVGAHGSDTYPVPPSPLLIRVKKVIFCDHSRMARVPAFGVFHCGLERVRCGPFSVLSQGGRSWVRPFQDSLVMNYSAMGVPAYFLPIMRAKSSTELRGRWFTTRCWAFPAALRLTVTTTLVGSPWI